MIYRFSDTMLDTEAASLTRGGQVCACEPKAFALLQYLIECRDRVVGKDELIDKVWQRVVVSDSALNSCVNAARQAVGDDGRAQRVIKTVPKRGYRFIADIDTGIPETAQSAAGTPSIAVLPFRNLSGDPAQGLFAEGMLEDLTMKLSRIRWLVVIGSGTMFTFADRRPSLREVADDLDVRYVVSGSVRATGSRLRVSVQLFDCHDDRAIWGDLYDRAAADIFDLQDEVTMHVAAAVEHELGRAEQSRASAARPEDLDAWLAYQRALSLIRRGEAVRHLAEIKDLFDRAIALDEGFALAHAGRAFVEYWAFMEGLAPMNRDLAFQHALQAIQLDPDEPFAHQAVGAVYWADANYQAANDAFNRVLELNPSFAWSHCMLGFTCITMDDIASARRHIGRAVRLSPRDTLIGIFYAGLALCDLVDGNDAGCVAWGRRAMAYPQPRWVHAYVLSAAGHLGDAAEARTIRDLMARVRPDFSLAYIEANFHALRGAPRRRFLDGLRKAGLRRD